MKKIFTLFSLLLCSVAFSQFAITETHQNISCNGNCDGNISITPVNAIGAVSYTWIPIGSNSNNLCAGQYTILAQDAGANTASVSVTITNFMTATVTVLSNVSCYGLCDGSASITVSGGTAPYVFSWQDGSVVNSATELCHGTNFVYIFDENGCSQVEECNITEPLPITITTTPTNPTCFNSCTGAINTTVTGGVAAYSYSWTSSNPLGNGLNSANPTGLCLGSYTLIVTDALGCSKIAGETLYMTPGVNSIPNTTITSTSYNETCYLTGDGAIDVNITGSNPGPFTYLWSNGATTQDISNVSSGNYFVTVYDAAMNCFAISDTIRPIGVNCGTISGNIFVDNNNDCVKNGGDLDFNNASVIINPGNRYGYSNTNGDYIINNLPYGTYSVSLNTLQGTCNQTLIATVNSGSQNSVSNNLSVSASYTLQPDMNVSGFSSPIVPGFLCSVYYVLNNLNMNNASGLFKLTLPTAFIPNISSALPSTYSVSGDTLIWAYSNVSYNNSKVFIVSFTVPLSTPLSSVFNSCGLAQTITPDLNPLNNTYSYQRIVTGSFDPNDKTVSPVGAGATGDISASVTDLTYLIRFQNTGNGPAVNVVVKDTLSSNVDINSFEMLGSSHNYLIDILDNNVLRWKFNNIMLPDSNSNEPASHGYIQYRIKRTANNTPGTQIKNTAYIYFDFNEPVVTNTALNTIETITDIKSYGSNNSDWNVYPNPSTGILHIANSTSLKATSQIQIINSIGQTVFEETMNSNYKNIDLSKLNNGIYFVKITSDKYSIVKRVVLSR